MAAGRTDRAGLPPCCRPPRRTKGSGLTTYLSVGCRGLDEEDGDLQGVVRRAGERQG